MRRKLAALFFGLLLVTAFRPVSGQGISKIFKPFTVYGGSGTSHYFGDVVDDFYWTINGQVNAGITYNLHPRFQIGLDYTFFRLRAHDKNSDIKELRNLSFFSNNYELAFIAKVPIFELPEAFWVRKVFHPYLMVGVGGLFFTPKAKYEGEKYFLRPLRTEAVDYSPFTIVIPAGLGINYKLNAFLDVTLEGGFRFTFTDYLDDVSSGIYPDPDSFDNPIARALSDRSGEIGVNPPFAEEPRHVRGNPNERDNYFLVNLKVAFYFSPVNDASRVIRYQGTKKNMKKRKRR